MTKSGLHRRKLKRNSPKGAMSDLLVMAIIFLLVVSVVMPLFIFIQGSASQHRSTTALRKSLDLQKQSEKVFIRPIDLGNQLYANLTNASPIPVRIVRVYVVNVSNQNITASVSPSSFINTGQKVGIPMGIAYPTGFDIKVVTERGNIFTLGGEVQGPPSPLGDCGDIWDYLGPGSIIYEDFSYESSLGKEDIPYWKIDSKAKNVVWTVTMVNHGTQDITLNASSAFVLIGTGQSNKWVYFIVDENSSSGDLKAYNESSPTVIRLEKHPEGDRCAGGPETTVKFGSKDPATGSPMGDVDAPPAGSYAVFLVMVGTDEEGKQIAQNIPFVGLYVE